MAGTINHRHVTAIADTGADVDHDEWNDSLVVAGGSHGQFMRRDTGAGDGWSLSSLVAGDIPDLSATYQPLITTLAVNKGGTGLASYAVGDIPYASGTTTLSALAVGAAGTVLVGGSTPSYSATPTVTTLTVTTALIGPGTVAASGDVRLKASGVIRSAGSIFYDVPTGFTHRFQVNGATIVNINGTTNGFTTPNIAVAGYADLVESTPPAAPGVDTVRLYADDNGSGKTRLMALFSSGAAQQIAIQP
jgi:hypothetical protein